MIIRPKSRTKWTLWINPQDNPLRKTYFYACLDENSLIYCDFSKRNGVWEKGTEYKTAFNRNVKQLFINAGLRRVTAEEMLQIGFNYDNQTY